MKVKNGYAILALIFTVWLFDSASAATLTVGPSGSHTTVQAAIDAANSGDVIEVDAGDFNEALSINKPLTISGPNSAVLGTGARLPEARINGGITVTSADNVTIEGLKVTNPSATTGIYGKYSSGLTIRNNVIDEVNTSSSGSASGVYILNSTAPISDIEVTGNLISNIGSSAASVSVKGIYFGDSTGNSTVSNVLVTNNSIQAVTVGSKGAYGIMFNYGASSGTGTVGGIEVSNNAISGLSGGWVHAIAMETNTGAAVITGNVISGLSAAGADEIGIFFEDNPTAGTAVVRRNSFSADTNYGVAVSSGTPGVDATENYWGDAYGPAGAGAKAGPGVTFSPWYADAALTLLRDGLVEDTVITGPVSLGDLYVAPGTTVTVTPEGALAANKLELAQGAELVVNGGSLEIGDGSVISGTFTVFNSFGSWNINGDTTFTVNQTLALITDIHVAGGKTLTVNGGGELVLDGCVIDSQTPGTPYNIIADADGIMTMARSNVTDAMIDINTVDASVPANLRSRVYDNSFTNSDVEATADSRVYHNFFDTPTNTDSNTDTTTAFDAVDGWGNVTSVGELQNTFTLDFVLPGPGAYAGRTLDSDGNLFVQTDDPVGMTLDIGDLNSSNITGITAAEALLGYNSDMLTSPSVTPTTGPAVQDWEVIQTTMTSPSTLGYIDSALGLEFTTGPATGSVDNMTAATVNFTAGTAGYTYGFFRVQTDRVFDGNGVFLKDTRLTQYDPSAPGNWSYVAPYTSNTGSLVIDNAAPVINVASATATQDQPSFAGVDVLNGANPMFRQASDVVVTFNATDNGYGLSGLDAADAGDDLVLEMVQGTNTQPLVLGTDYAITSAVDSSGVVTYSLAIAPSFATVSGTYELNAMVRDRSGNFSVNTQLGTFTVQNEALVNVELQGFVGASRDVTFVASINGVAQVSWTKTVSNFSGATGSVILDDVPVGTTHISAKTAWNLRSKVAYTSAPSGQADFTGADLLPGGDITGDNVINTLDYSTLVNGWGSITLLVADINGDSGVFTADYNLLADNFLTGGDAE